MDGLFVDMKAAWWPIVQQELLTFPAGKHDDIVDSLGLVGQMLAMMVSPSKPPAPKPKNHLNDYVEMTSEQYERDFANPAPWFDDTTDRLTPENFLVW